jgi:paraquat-inducible protein B
MNEQNRPRSLEDLPKAIVQRNWKTGLFWLIPLAAAGLAGYFVYTQLLSGGPEVQISFDNAQGLQAGKSDVKYRGAEIGTVKNIQLAETLVSGGIDFATPDTTEKEAPRGTAFRLYDKPEDAWLAWAPRIKLGEEPQTNGAEFSQNSR